MPELLQLLPLVGAVAVFWLLVLRPARRRQAEHVALQDALGLGDEIMLTSGVYGHVRGLEEDRVRVEVAPGVVLTVARGAVGARLSDPEPSTDSTGSTGSDDPIDPTDQTPKG